MLVTVGGKGSVTLRRLVGLQRILLVQGRGNEPRVEIYAGDESLWPGSTKSVHVISGWYRAPRTSPPRVHARCYCDHAGCPANVPNSAQKSSNHCMGSWYVSPARPSGGTIDQTSPVNAENPWTVHWVWAMYGEHCVSHRLRHLALTFAWSFGCWEPLEHPDVAMPSLEQVLAAARLM